MKTTAMLEQEKVILDLDYLENLVEQEKCPEKDKTNFHIPDNISSELPTKNIYHLQEIAWLDNALFLQTYKSDSQEIKKLTDQIFEEIKINEENTRNKRINEAHITKKTLKMVLINLWIGYFYGQPIMFFLDRNKYTLPRRYKKGYLTYDRLQIVIRNIEELGYIEIKKGYFYDKGDNRNRISRMWATPKLFKNFLSSTNSEIPDFYEPDKPKDIIILRDKNNKKDIDYKDNKKTRKMREQLQNHNEFINQHTITVELDGEVEISNSFLVETLYKNIINRKIKIKNIVTKKNITRLPVKIPHRDRLMEDLLKLEFVQDKNNSNNITVVSEGFRDQVDNVNLIKNPKGGNKADYLLARIKREAPEGNNQFCPSGSQGYNVTLTKCSKRSLMNFLKKSQKNMTTPAFQTNNHPTNTRIFYRNPNMRPTLPHHLSYTTGKLTNNITDIQYNPTHRYLYITDKLPYHHIYSISDVSYKYTPSSITNTNICKPLISHDFNSKLLSEKLLLKMLKTCNRISGFLKNLDNKNKPKKKKSDKKKYTEEQQKNFQSKKCDNNKKFLGLKFKLKDIGIQYLELELSYTHAHRVFGRGNKKFKYNGRFYGPVYQSIPGDLRKYIKINGEPVVELDFSALHIRMLYHQHDIDYQDDPYEVCGDHRLRKTFKQAFLIVINAESEEIAKKSLLKKMYEKNLPWPGQKNPINHIVDTIKKEHNSICDCICDDKGVELMRKDSDIMENILMTLMNENIPGLSVHDSVIVPKRHEARLRQVMMEQYKKIMGFDPVID